MSPIGSLDSTTRFTLMKTYFLLLLLTAFDSDWPNSHARSWACLGEQGD